MFWYVRVPARECSSAQVLYLPRDLELLSALASRREDATCSFENFGIVLPYAMEAEIGTKNPHQLREEVHIVYVDKGMHGWPAAVCRTLFITLYSYNSLIHSIIIL